MKNTNKSVSEKQLAANRRNTERSTGLCTVAGRAASKFNAVKHVILFQKLLTERTDAATDPRNKCLDRDERVYQARLRASVLRSEAALEKIHHYETRPQRQLPRAMTDLERLQASRQAREAESAEMSEFCQTNPFCPQPASVSLLPWVPESPENQTNPFTKVRIPPSGDLGVPLTTAVQTNPFPVNPATAASIPSEGRALRVPDLISQLTTNHSQFPDFPAKRTHFSPSPPPSHRSHELAVNCSWLDLIGVHPRR